MREKSRELTLAEHTLWYEREAKNFNEALPLGNGRIGACVYGGVEEETVSLNEDTLWSGYPKTPAGLEGLSDCPGIRLQAGEAAPGVKSKESENYPEIYRMARELCRAGKFGEAQELVENKFGDYLVQMYLPLGKLKIKHIHSGSISSYCRELRLDEAVHWVTYRLGGREYVRESFVSPVSQVYVLRLRCSQPGGISFAAWLESPLKSTVRQVPVPLSGEKHPIRDDGSGTAWALLLEGHAPNCVSDYGKGYPSTDCQVYSEHPAEQGMGFAAALALRAVGGSVRWEMHKSAASGTEAAERVIVTGADEVILYVAARTGFAGWNVHPGKAQVPYVEYCLSDIRKAMALSYQELLEQHKAAHRELYSRVSLTLGSSGNSGLPTDRRLQLHGAGQEDPALYTLLFNYGRYLAISASREGTQPGNLQGIWNEKLLPPWNSNYTLNINTEMNYWPLLACGLPECYEPLLKMTEELAESGRETARRYYGAEGWVCHHSTDLWRLTHPGTNRIKKNAQWGFWNMASGWLSVMLWDYYRYTGDADALKRIYPVMEGAARFYRQLLTEEDGELVLSPSTSPENNYIEDGQVHALDCSTAMTQEILLELFSAVSKAQRLLGIEDGYKDLLLRLKKPGIQRDGLLCEWDREHEVWDAHHRHVSHLYGLFPANQFDEARKEAAKKVLEQRGDGGTGWSLAWKINLWARLGDGEHALLLLDNQLKPVPSDCDTPDRPGGSYPNLFCAHPPFQIDGNFGAVSGILEMLVQTDEEGNPVLLPALPESWREGRAEGIRLPGGKKISFAWQEGRVISSEITEA